ncbi:MAG: PCC domain-containing protein, partial [Anaerotignum sp.]
MITAAQGNIKRIVAARMSPGEDVLLGLEKICKDYGIKDGVILSGIGSLDGAQFFNPVPLKDKKAGFGYSEPIVLRGAIELVNMSGMIC